MPQKALTWTFLLLPMPSTRLLSICVCRCSRGHHSDRPRQQSRCTRDLRGSIPSFIHISSGKLHDVRVLDLLIPEPGAFYVMDRGYLSHLLWSLHPDLKHV